MESSAPLAVPSQSPQPVLILLFSCQHLSVTDCNQTSYVTCQLVLPFPLQETLARKLPHLG